MAQSACGVSETRTKNGRSRAELKGPRVTEREVKLKKNPQSYMRRGKVGGLEGEKLRHDLCLAGSGTDKADISHVPPRISTL